MYSRIKILLKSAKLTRKQWLQSSFVGIAANIFYEIKIFNYKIEESEPTLENPAFCYSRTQSQLNKAMKDSGVKGEIIFRQMPQFNAGILSVFNSKMTRIHFLLSDPKLFLSFTEKEIYAVGGHEAAHAKKHHQNLDWGFSYASLYLLGCHFFNLARVNPLFGVMVLPFYMKSFTTVPHVISQAIEFTADVGSAKKLGTHQELASALKKTPPQKKEIPWHKRDHPHRSFRIQYLLFFQSITEFKQQNQKRIQDFSKKPRF